MANRQSVACSAPWKVPEPRDQASRLALRSGLRFPGALGTSQPRPPVGTRALHRQVTAEPAAYRPSCPLCSPVQPRVALWVCSTLLFPQATGTQD